MTVCMLGCVSEMGISFVLLCVSLVVAVTPAASAAEVKPYLSVLMTESIVIKIILVFFFLLMSNTGKRI